MRIKPNRISKLIKHKRLELGVSQAELARLLGWSKPNTQYISNIERNACNFPARSITELIRVTSIDAESIINAMTEDYRDSLKGAIYETTKI